jgi:hypothetical protein
MAIFANRTGNGATLCLAVIFILFVNLLVLFKMSSVEATPPSPVGLIRTAPANLAFPALKAAAEAKTEVFCTMFDAPKSQFWSLDWTNVRRVNTVGNFPQFVYGTNDIVSSAMSGGGWENHIIAILEAGLKYHSEKQGLAIEDTILLDIGANVGSLLIAIANKGYQCVGFEPMLDNVLMMQRTLCANPQMKVCIFSVQYY